MEPRFHIGVARPKVKKRIMKKRKSINEFCIPNCNFNVYTGYRWKIPKYIKATASIQSKFGSIETLSKVEVIRFLNHKIKFPLPIFYFEADYNKIWMPSKYISHIQHFKDTQIIEWKKVKCIYFRIFKMRSSLFKLAYIYRINKTIRNIRNTEDPVTLEAPKKPVYVIDIKNKCSYKYEASTLRRTIENKILYSDYMFPEPKAPINMLTNVPFTYGQLVSIYNQCTAYGEFSWAFNRFKACDFDLIKFERRFRQQVKIEAIEYFFKNQYITAKETVIEYFNSIADREDLPYEKIAAFLRMYNINPTSPIIRNWINITKRYYISIELKDAIDILNISSETETLLRSTYYALF